MLATDTDKRVTAAGRRADSEKPNIIGDAVVSNTRGGSMQQLQRYSIYNFEIFVALSR